jgi:hypothetical protein
MGRISRSLSAHHGGVSLVKGLYHWAQVFGIGASAMRFIPARPTFTYHNAIPALLPSVQ